MPNIDWTTTQYNVNEKSIEKIYLIVSELDPYVEAAVPMFNAHTVRIDCQADPDPYTDHFAQCLHQCDLLTLKQGDDYKETEDAIVAAREEINTWLTNLLQPTTEVQQRSVILN